jgi:hypothetical protein
LIARRLDLARRPAGLAVRKLHGRPHRVGIHCDFLVSAANDGGATRRARDQADRDQQLHQLQFIPPKTRSRPSAAAKSERDALPINHTNGCRTPSPVARDV